MKKHSVLILGASSDISIALAHKFAAAGHPIQLVSRSPNTMKRHQSDINLRYDVEVTLLSFDVLDVEKVEMFFDNLSETPTVVISMVGFMERASTVESRVDVVRKVIDTNFTGPAFFLEIAAQRLSRLETQTAVIGISSVAGDRGRNKNYWYGASKAGLTSALSAMRQRYQKSNLHVMTVCLGFVATKMTEGLDLPKALISTPEDTASLIIDALTKKKDVVYTWKWLIIMTIIKIIPEKLFKKLSF
jgi:decaprenylphospho-beta-D-erythro-pentofuranosid-2-ulose 2-reductase